MPSDQKVDTGGSSRSELSVLVKFEKEPSPDSDYMFSFPKYFLT
jgi:hypothetical protein